MLMLSTYTHQAVIFPPLCTTFLLDSIQTCVRHFYVDKKNTAMKTPVVKGRNNDIDFASFRMIDSV